MNSTFSAADGLQLAYYVDDFTDPWRKPDTVILLHAAMGDSRRWFQWVLLSRRYRVVRLDLRGHGNSQIPKPTDDFSLSLLGTHRVATDILFAVLHCQLSSEPHQSDLHGRIADVVMTEVL
jgi:pimeloyl-ACP methyl ester carboxylesterase